MILNQKQCYLINSGLNYFNCLTAEHKKGVVLQIDLKEHKNKNYENFFIFIYFKHNGV